jgi:hypothetical protein
MKLKKLFFTLIICLSNISFSQTVEERKEGESIIKSYLNNDLEIIKIEKVTNKQIIESYEYLPGGKIKNGKFHPIKRANSPPIK